MITEARAVALEVVRETFEDGAFTERAFRAAADSLELSGRERAQAQRLAYGAVQRRATTDAAIARLSSRPPQRLDPPVLAALRLGLFELLFGDATPDHAAVDQAVESVRAAGAAHATGLVNAVLRRAARERAELTAALLDDDSTPERAAVAHSAPLWLARMWWEELGPDAARSMLAACNEPAEVAFRARPEGRDETAAALREEGVDVAPAAGEWPLAAPEMLVLEGRMGEGALARIAAGELTPQSRGSAAVVEVARPPAGRARPRPLRGARDQDRPDRRADGRTRRDDVGRARPRPRRRCRGPGREARAPHRHRRRGRCRGRRDRGRIRPRPRRCSLLGPRRARLAAGRALAQEPAGDRAPGRGPERDPRPRRRVAPRPGGPWSTRPARSPAARTRTGSRRCARPRRERRLPPLEIEDLGALAPALASHHDRRCLQIRPDRDSTTGFFISRLRRDD